MRREWLPGEKCDRRPKSVKPSKSQPLLRSGLGYIRDPDLCFRVAVRKRALGGQATGTGPSIQEVFRTQASFPMQSWSLTPPPPPPPNAHKLKMGPKFTAFGRSHETSTSKSSL